MSLDIAPLSGNVRDSFAYQTIKDRLPVILAQAVDSLYRNREYYESVLGSEGIEKIKFVIGQLSRLRHELTTNKPLTLLEDVESEDIEFWDNILLGTQHRKSPDSENDPDEEISSPKDRRASVSSQYRWFTSSWLLVECYMYRRIQEAVNRSGLTSFDIFRFDKEKSFTDADPSIRVLATSFLDAISQLQSNETPLAEKKHIFEQFLKVCLFGNQCDLSISTLGNFSPDKDPVVSIASKQKQILVDDFEHLWAFLNELPTQQSTIFIILDNSGFELIGDLCLAECLISCGFAKRVIFFGKSIPWFVSDVTKNDIEWTLKVLGSNNHYACDRLRNIIAERFKLGEFEYNDHIFWTLACDYSCMSHVSPDLYTRLKQEASLIIFKGDLNYRKLVGDLSWHTDTSFKTALREFKPAPVVSLRVCKADVAVGLSEDVASRVSQECENWMTIGQYALLQANLSV